MIVRYARERGYKGPGIDESLTLGKSYLVLGILIEIESVVDEVPQKHKICVQCDDDNYPCLFDLACFDIVDPRLPNNWIFYYLQGGAYRVAPQEFHGDFWELFHDGDTEAERIFEEVVKKTHLFHDMVN